MEMKPSEILQSYENAQHKTKQISILAELNACSKDEITDILKEMGAELPKRKYQKKEEPAKEPEKKEWEEPEIKALPEPREQPAVVLNETVAMILFGRLDEIEARLRILESQKKKLESQYLDICKCLGVAKEVPCEDLRGPGM